MGTPDQPTGLGETPQPVSFEQERLHNLLGVEECIRYYPPNLSPVQDADSIFRNRDTGSARREIDIFVDVPFCKTICGFCPFNVYPYDKAKAHAYLRSLELEVIGVKQRHDFSKTRVRTLWIGGGTPSVMEEAFLERILSLLHEHFDLSQLTEFTVEIKPARENLTDSKIALLRRHGVKRISMGVQSANDDFLRILGRGHTSVQALDVVGLIKDAGFTLNIDMMYRLPGQTPSQVDADIAAVSSLGIDHMSWFPYVPHEGTSLANRLERGRVSQRASRDDYYAMFVSLSERMARAGFDQYTPYHFGYGDRCHYHVGRWQMPQRDTLGLGAGAFSHFNGWIYANEHDPAKYQRAVESHKAPVMVGKQLTEAERITRLAVLGIKFFSLDAKVFQRHTGESLMAYYESELGLLKEAGLINIADDRVVCTLPGRAFNNDIATILSTDTAKRTRHPQAIDLMDAK
jgi:oxygen-independent coproporphyrinogen-3 oxidase